MSALASRIKKLEDKIKLDSFDYFFMVANTEEEIEEKENSLPEDTLLVVLKI